MTIRDSHTVTDHLFDSYRELAATLGFLELGAAPAQPVRGRHRAAVDDWVANGHCAEMDWYARGLPKRLDPHLVMDGVQTVLVLAASYHPEPVTLGSHRLARYACGDDYHDVLLKHVKRLCSAMAADFPEARFRPYVDTGPVLERYWAQRSGLGWIGKNGMLISKTAGSYTFLATILTDLRFPHRQQMHSDHCGSCRACLDICPTDAFPRPGMVDSRRCISYWTIEHRGALPKGARLNGWLFGCDLCQEVCPWNIKFAGPTDWQQFQPRASYTGITDDQLAAMDDEAFSQTFRKSPIKRTKRAGLQRNAEQIRLEHQSSGPNSGADASSESSSRRDRNHSNRA